MKDFLATMRLVGSWLLLLAIASITGSSQVCAFQTASSSSSFLTTSVPRSINTASSSSSSSSSIWQPTVTSSRSSSSSSSSSIINKKSELYAGKNDDESTPFSFLTKLPDPFNILKGDGGGGDSSKSSDDDGAAFQPTPLGLVRQARRVLACDYGILDASLLDDAKFIWIGPFIDQPLTKVEYLAAGRFFDLRAAFPDLDYRPHDFRIAEQEQEQDDNDDNTTVRFTCRVTGTMRGALRLRTGTLPPTGKVMKCPPEAVSMTFDANTGKLIKLCTGFALDRQVGNTGGATGVMAASLIAGEPPSDWDLYPATTVIARFFGRPIRPIVEQKSVLAPFPETVMIQLAKGVLATNMASKDESLLADKFEFCTPYIGPVKKREFLEKYATKEFENVNPSFSHFRVDPYDPVRVWVDVLPKSTNKNDNGVSYSGAPQAMSFAFDEDGFCTRITSSYVMDPSIGNGGGLGGPEGYLYAMGKPSPVFLTRPYARIMGRVRKSILSPITGVGVDDYVSTTPPRLERSVVSAVAKPPKSAPAPPPKAAKSPPPHAISPPKPAVTTPIEKLASLRSLSNIIIPEPSDSKTRPFSSKPPPPPEPGKKKPVSSPTAPKSTIRSSSSTSTAAAPPQRSAPKKSPKLIVTPAAPSPKSTSSSASLARAKQAAAQLEQAQRQKQAQLQLEEAARLRRQKEAQQAADAEARRRQQQQQEQQQESLRLEEEKRQERQRKLQAAEKEAAQRKRQEEEAAILAEKARAAAKARMAAAAEAKLRRVEQERMEAERQLELAQSAVAAKRASTAAAEAVAAARQREAEEKARAKQREAEEKARAKAKSERQQAALDAISRAVSSASVSLFGLSGGPQANKKTPAAAPRSTLSLLGLSGNVEDDSDTKKPKRTPPPPPTPSATISLFGGAGDEKKATTTPTPKKAPAKASPTVSSSPTISLFGYGSGGGSTDSKDTPARKVAAAKASTDKVRPASPSISLFGSGGGTSPPPKKSATAAAAKSPTVVSRSPTISLFGYGGGSQNVQDSTRALKEQVKNAQAKQRPPPPPKKASPPAAAKKVAPVKKTAPNGVPTISRWRRNSDGSVTGNISGSNNFANGEKVTTSPISGGIVQSGEVVRTGSGSRYFLG